MKKLFLLLSIPFVCYAASYEISDHTIVGTSVKTLHVRCQSGNLGMIWVDDKNAGNEICAGSQSGSFNKCGSKQNWSIEAAAEELCVQQ